MHIRQAIIPVAGLGTRFLPATKAMPKEMLNLIDRPLIHYVVEEALAAGIERFIFITGIGKDAIENHFDPHPFLNHKIPDLQSYPALNLPAGAIAYVRQGEAKGLGHALYCARHLITDEAFAVLLPDDVFLGAKAAMAEVVEAYHDSKQAVVGLVSVPQAQAHKYGIVSWKDSKHQDIASLVEKPQGPPPSLDAIAGRYVLKPEIFDLLSQQAPDAKGEIQLTPALDQLAQQGKVQGRRLSSQRFDCGDKLGFLKANLAFGLNHPELKDDFADFLKQFLDR